MLRSRPVTLAAAVAVIAGLMAQGPRPAAQSGSTMHAHSNSSYAWLSASGFPRALYDSTMRMHEEMLRTLPSGNADIDFLVQMIPHHEGAVEMARLYLAAGDDPLVRRLAEEIIAGQQAEITAMKARLSILRKGADPSPGDFPSLGGARGR